jgi:hypothetical protein
MSYQLDVEKRGNFLYATVTGTNNAETVLNYMNEVKDRCTAEDCYRVLIDERLDGPRMDEMEIFAMISEGTPDALGFFEALAYVDQEQDFEVVKFAETVAVNRGIPVAVFSSVEDAENWLRHRDSDQSGQDIFTGPGPGDETD